MKKIISRRIAQIAAAIPALMIPTSTFAVTNNLCDLAKSAVYYFNLAIELIIGLAIVVFIFNVYRYFFLSKENKERGMYLLWSIVGFAVIICFWGLVNLVANTFNFNNSAPTMFGLQLGGNQPGTSPCTATGSSNSLPSNGVGAVGNPSLSGPLNSLPANGVGTPCITGVYDPATNACIGGN